VAAASDTPLPLRAIRRAWIPLRSAAWPPYSRLFLLDTSGRWSISEDVRALGTIAHRLGIALGPPAWSFRVARQCVFYASHFALLRRFAPPPSRLATAYFHGRPGTPEFPEFDEAYASLRRNHEALHRVQVTHAEMHELVLGSGIAPEKVFRIPIGVDPDLFRLRTPEDRREARARLGLPEAAFVAGSLQKDGLGFEDGFEPKLIKGPDVLLAALGLLRPLAPELVVLLTGPARGYVRRGLERAGIPYRHVYVDSYRDLPSVFQALDVCLIASRQEGGPKALLESMASGVPVVTTRVGQAGELAQHQQNAFVVDVDDVEGLAHWAGHIRQRTNALGPLLERARATAVANGYAAQTPLWREFMSGFVQPPG
jgi:glycosyltransferase involved in cell wall biosynthesis